MPRRGSTPAGQGTEVARLTRERDEALEQQTATSDVLQIISSTPGILSPCSQTMLEKAVRICDAKFGNINRCDGDALHLVAAHNTPPAFAEFRRRSPTAIQRLEGSFGRFALSDSQMHVHLARLRHKDQS